MTAREDKAWLDQVHRMACICCVRRMVTQPFPTEAHHLLSGGRRIGHTSTIPLCGWHHRAVVTFGWTLNLMERRYGPSLARGSKPFHDEFGNDQKLLESTQALAA